MILTCENEPFQFMIDCGVQCVLGLQIMKLLDDLHSGVLFYSLCVTFKERRLPRLDAITTPLHLGACDSTYTSDSPKPSLPTHTRPLDVHLLSDVLTHFGCLLHHLNYVTQPRDCGLHL